MSSLWIVWIIVQEYGYVLTTANKLQPRGDEGCDRASVNRTIAHDNPHEPRLALAAKPQYIDYKLHYGLRYNPPPLQASARNLSQERQRKNLLLSAGQLGAHDEPLAPPLLTVFHIISFVNGPCVSRSHPDDGTTWAGVCYHEQECRILYGMPMDSCAGGFGVCCVFRFGCEGRTEQNVSYFHSPHYPAAATDSLSCGFTLLLQRTVRQVLLEFVFFELQPPQLGNCVEDQFIVSVQNDQRPHYPVLCGINTGQHMYLDIDRAYSHSLYLSTVFNSKQPRAFLVKITQLTTIRAPAGCLQFHEGVSGVLKSFNYDNGSVLVINRKASYFVSVTDK
uniref:CUB domain-containing protein n=1 Tax=Anopheles melas TaxID=34690 RepID=A0A182TZJ7_9DIPT